MTNRRSRERSTVVSIRACVLAIVCLGAGISTTVVTSSTSAAGATPGQRNTSRSLTATPDSGLDGLFQFYGNSGTGNSWTGGDGTESVTLPDGRELWLFSDTFLGSDANGVRNSALTPYIHNSLVAEVQGKLTATYFTHRGGRPPTAYLNPKPRSPYLYSFWPGATVVSGSTLQ